MTGFMRGRTPVGYEEIEHMGFQPGDLAGYRAVNVHIVCARYLAVQLRWFELPTYNRVIVGSNPTTAIVNKTIRHRRSWSQHYRWLFIERAYNEIRGLSK